MTRAARLVLAVVVVAVLAACAGSSTANRGAPRAAESGPMPVLAASAVPGLQVSTRALPAQLLAKDTTIHGVADQLTADGYVAGRERTFQGPSRQLTLVTSRALAFDSPSGAAAFLGYLRAHAEPWFGVTTVVTALDSAGRRGWLFEPPQCACHLATPVLVGVVRDGRRLAWLSINGPAATRAVLDKLLVPSRSTTT